MSALDVLHESYERSTHEFKTGCDCRSDCQLQCQHEPERRTQGPLESSGPAGFQFDQALGPARLGRGIDLAYAIISGSRSRPGGLGSSSILPKCCMPPSAGPTSPAKTTRVVRSSMTLVCSEGRQRSVLCRPPRSWESRSDGAAGAGTESGVPRERAYFSKRVGDQPQGPEGVGSSDHLCPRRCATASQPQVAQPLEEFRLISFSSR